MGILAGEKILIGPSSFSAIDTRPMDMLRDTGAEVVDNPYKRRLKKAELLELLAGGITGLIAGLEPLDKEVMSASKLRVISRCVSGMSNVDQDAARELEITVCSTPDAPVDSVAELTLGAMLGLLRMIPFMTNELHNKRWSKKIGALLSGKTVGIIGFGRIGRRLYELLVPFKSRIVVVDPLYKEDIKDVALVSLEDALVQSDIICIHASGQECIIGPKELDRVKPGLLLLNAARGGLVDEAALAEALKAGRIGGVWLDAFEQEPYEGPLTGYPQVILTPHVGSYTAECRIRMETESVNNLITAFGGMR